ncbi:hypothetical protein NIES39_O01720 [Arthrospira platensis NIES-39]|nr:hypothetical protein NIES39_O01720 [Arthrospira platensis NIES-39]
MAGSAAINKAVRLTATNNRDSPTQKIGSSTTMVKFGEKGQDYDIEIGDRQC